MKYIPAEKLLAEIERRLKIVEPHKDTFESAAACRQELIWMKDFITSLQQEQTPTEHEIAEAHRYAEMIRERDKARIQQEQPEAELEKEIYKLYDGEYHDTEDVAIDA